MIKYFSLNFTKLFKLIVIAFFAIQLNACGLYRPVDARKVSPNPDERIAQNQKEGKGLRLANLGGKKSGDFLFASSNEMWRATIEILDFVPLTNVDYGGGIIVTDWYSDSNTKNESVKIMVQFLTNEIRSDSLKVNIYKKECFSENNCRTNVLKTELTSEIKLAILRKAATFKKERIEKK